MSTMVRTQVPSGTWSIDAARSSIAFGVARVGVCSFRASFPDVEGAVRTRDGRVVSVVGTARIGSLRTEDPSLTGRLLTRDCFDVDRSPTGTFRSTAVHQVGEHLTIEGDLTLRGVTRPITLTAELEDVEPQDDGPARLGISMTGHIDRTEFGISWNALLDSEVPHIAERVTLRWRVLAIHHSEAS